MSFLRRSSSSAAAAAAAAGDAMDAGVSATPSAGSSRRNSSSSPTPSVSTSAKSTMSVLHQYLASFAKGLPKIDKGSGVLYTVEEGTSGKESTTKRTWHSNPKLEDFGIGTSRPVVVIPPPRERALARRGGGGAVVVKGWTDADIKAAAREFEIPRGAKFLLMYPELMDRDILLAFGLWSKGLAGLCCICPHCGTNAHVSVDAFNVQRSDKKPRSAVTSDEDMRLFIMSPVYKCEAPVHSKERYAEAVKKGEPNPKFSSRAKKTWNLYTGEGWQNLPDEIKGRYGDYICDLELGEAYGATMVTPSFAYELLDDCINFGAEASKLEDRYNRLETAVLKDWADFVSEQVSVMEKTSDNNLLANTMYQSLPAEEKEVAARKMREMKWQSPDVSAISSQYFPPQEKALKGIFMKAFDQIEPYLRRDLYNQCGGRILRWDGVYGPAKKTINNPELEEDFNCLLFLMGEYNNYIGGYYVEEETEENAKRAAYLYYHRCCKFWGQEAINAVVAGYTDTCCGNSNDPADHWLAHLFPNCPRAPYKDLFHGMKTVTDKPSTHGSSHPLHASFCRGIRDIIVQPHPPHLEECVAHYMQENKQVRNKTIAENAVINSKSYKNRMSNCVRGSTNTKAVAEEMRELLRNMALEDDKNEAEANSKGEFYPRYLRADHADGTYGTQKQLENLLSHHKKGCFDDPLPGGEMFYEAAPTKASRSSRAALPVVKHSLRGSGGVERGNRSKNETVGHLSRQSEDVGNVRLLLFMTKQNNKAEKRVEHIPNRLPGVPGLVPAKPSDWYIREGLQGRVGKHLAVPLVDATVMPKKLEGSLEGYEEPVGTEFLKWKEWEQVMAECDEKIAAALSAIEEAATPSNQVDSDDADTAGYASANSNSDNDQEMPPLPPAIPIGTGNLMPMPAFDAGVVGFSYGGPKWSKGKCPPLAKPIQHLYCGLPASGQNLTPFQLQTIYLCMHIVRRRFPSSKDRCNIKYCQAVAEEWNRGHELAQIQNGGGVGYGGRVTDKQVMAFLQSQGLETIGSSVGVAPSPVGHFAASQQPVPALSMPPVPVQPPASWGGGPACFQPQQMHTGTIVYAKKPAQVKKPRLSLPDGYDDPSRVDSWNSRELERIIYEFGGVQRGSAETKKVELRRLLAKYQKKPPSSSKP